ncbi:MAG: glycosyltransferase, partial [Thermoproteota archaeon]|nr:glycosyltransferase [Thermoproteota archaeon]
MRVDLVMWTRDGAATLPHVLERINKVFCGVGGQRIIVDDCSRDGSVEICEKAGWAVYKNRGRGISDGANTALGLVESPFFCSFEQDLLLCADWPE